MANTVSNARKNLINDAARGLISAPFFTGTSLPPSYSFQGSNFGYTSGGDTPPYTNIIDKFPFASDGNASDVGDLTVARASTAGQSSTDNGYNAGGWTGSADQNVIDKFPFSSDTNATDVGDLIITRRNCTGQSSSENGYSSGGFSGTANPNYAFYNTIDKFPFSTDANASDVGDLTQGRYVASGQSSSENGYTSGGSRYSLAFPYTIYNIIDKFPFASDANATDVGDVTARNQTRIMAGQSSSENGYNSGGYLAENVIDKFPFASDTNATDVGDLTVGRRGSAGQSSTVSGYSSGGLNPPTYYNVIDKFPFASDANATDVGDLTVARYQPAGQQY